MEATPPYPSSSAASEAAAAPAPAPGAEIPIPPAPLSFMLHNKTEDQAEAEGLLPPDNPACDPETYARMKTQALEEGEIDGDGEDAGEGKENNEDDGEESDEGEIVDKKKRKKRRRKNKKRDVKIAIEVGSLGLKVMLKKEWKKLRNHYMDMQRLNFHRMKQALRNAQMELEQTPRFEADMKTVMPRVGVWPRKDAIPTSVVQEVEARKNDNKKASEAEAGTSSQVEREIAKVKPDENPIESQKHPWREKPPSEGGQNRKSLKRKRPTSEAGSEAGGPKRPKVPFEERLDQEAWRKLPYVPDCIVKILHDFSSSSNQSVSTDPAIVPPPPPPPPPSANAAAFSRDSPAVESVKALIRSVVTPENIDVRPEIDAVYVRCRDKLSAMTLLNSPHFPGGAACLVQGTEQALYWQRVWQNFKEKRKRRRGKERLQRRIDRFMRLPGFAQAFAGQLSPGGGESSDHQPVPSSSSSASLAFSSASNFPGGRQKASENSSPIGLGKPEQQDKNKKKKMTTVAPEIVDISDV